MNKVVLSVLSLLLAASLHAQTTDNIVYLKNGSVIKGDVIESVPDRHIKVRTADGSIFVYQMTEVDRIVRDETSRSKSASDTPAGWQQQGHRGLDFTVSLGPDINFGSGNSSASFATEVEVGKKFNKNFYFGVGSGINAGGGNVVFPLYGSIRTFFPSAGSRVTPTLLFQGGYTFNPDYDGMGRIVLMPGIQVPVNAKVDFNCGLGYIGAFGNGASAHGLGIRVGFGFHQATNGVTRRGETRDNGLQYEVDLATKTPWNEDRVGVGFGLVLGYKVNPALSFGFGYSVGPASTPYTTYEETSTQSDHSNATKGEENDFSEEPIQHSLFARAKYRLNDNRFSPFFAVDMGWHFFGWDDNVGSMKLEYGYGLDKDKLRKVGFFLTPAVGGSLRVAPNSYLDIRLGYELGTKAIGNAESEWTGYRSFSRTVQKGKSLSGLTIGVSFVHTLKYFSK